MTFCRWGKFARLAWGELCTRKDTAVINLAMIRRMSLNMLRCNGNQKGSIKSRKIRAGADDTMRAAYIFGDHRPSLDFCIMRTPCPLGEVNPRR